MNWRTSTHSGHNGQCAEVASWGKSRRGVIGVRDSKLGVASPVLEFSPGAWQAFTGSLRTR